MSKRLTIEPPGRWVEVGSRRVHVVESGAGIPVVFEAGAGEWSSHWERVTAALGDGLRSVTYDRAGLGWSEPVASKRSSGVLAGELLDLLDTLEIERPVILVAHSFGASIARCFAARAPQRLLGIVFVDGWHESFEEWERENTSKIRESRSHRLLAWLDRLGALRITSQVLERISPSPCPWPLAESTWQAMTTISLSKVFARTTLSEAAAYDESNAEVVAAGGLELPIRVLVAEETLIREHAPPGYPVDGHNAAWREASSKLASLAEHSETRFLSGTDHMVQLTRPEAVVEAIRDLVEKVAGSESRAE